MSNTLKELMTAKTDQELLDYLIDIKDYSSAEINAALEELQKRGKLYNQAQLNYFNNVIKRKKLEESPDTPTYYSEQAITLFSLLFSVLGGAILLSLNIKERKEKFTVIGFGITYLLFLSLVHNRTGLIWIALLLNGLGAALLQFLFWNRYIGKNIFYHKRSILIPLLIGFALLIAYLLPMYSELIESFMKGFRARL